MILSRKISERILIGDKIVVTVVRIGPNAVRLGIDCPKDLVIVREELVETSRPIQLTEDDIHDLGTK